MGIKIFFKGIFWVIYVLSLFMLGALLFFGDQVMFLANSLAPVQEEHAAPQRLVIAYALPVSSLDPTLFDSVTRSRLVNIYEGLVRTDRNLKIQPAIAVSWGLLNPTTWEFKLRPHVKFHNGNEVTARDVVASIDRAQNFEGSQLKPLLNTVQKVDAIDDLTIHVTTSVPDPLLLNKLAVTYILPVDYTNFDQPEGTGPYQMMLWDKGNQMILKRFTDYWGQKPFYDEVTTKTIRDKDERIQALMDGSVQLLADVPPAAVKHLVSDKIVTKSIPSLEVSFLMFNTQNGFFKERAFREAVAEDLNPQVFVDIAGGYAHSVGQFVSSGVFGYNPELPITAYNPDDAKKKAGSITSQSFERSQTVLNYAFGSEIIAQYVQSQLLDLGIDVDLNPMSPDDFQKKLNSGTSEFYYLGWRSELGDDYDFLQSVAHSRDVSGRYGQFNGANYMNKKVDQLIESSDRDLNESSRLKSLQEAMKILVQDDLAGVPLFETETIFAYQNTVNFDPRVDGYIYVSEIK